MSLDLFVLTPAGATSFEQALAVVMEEEAGATDSSGQLVAYAQDVYDAYGDDDFPGQSDHGGQFSPDAQRTMSGRIGATVVGAEPSHSVYVSQPAAVADLVKQAAAAAQ